jgi:hypothetical protein
VLKIYRVLTHREHASLRVVVGDEVNVRELGDRMTDALVDAAGEIAALDVRDGLVQICGGHRIASCSNRSPQMTTTSGSAV